MHQLEEALEDFSRNQAIELIDIQEERDDLREVRKFRDEDIRLLHSLDERKELDGEIKELNDRMKVLKDERSVLKHRLTLKKQFFQKKKKKIDEFQRERGKKGEVRVKMEKVLKSYGIHRPVYHGGDLTGVKVKVLLQNIDEIFRNDFKQIITDVEDKIPEDDEVYSIINMYRDLGFLLDGLFSIARLGCGELSEDDFRLGERYVNGIKKMWRYLRLSNKGPKIHGLGDHLIDQMEVYNGKGDFFKTLCSRLINME